MLVRFDVIAYNFCQLLVNSTIDFKSHLLAGLFWGHYGNYQRANRIDSRRDR